MDVKELVSQFESLGDNCEFGAVQRRAGIEPLGLFRWNWAPLPALLKVLDAELANIDPGRVEIQLGRYGEYIAQIEPWGFRHHTHQFDGSVDPGQLREQQIKVIDFLTRKLLEDLRSATKIFVRRGPDTNTLDRALALHRRLRHFGPNTLLWVVPEGGDGRAGTVEVLEPGLLKAHIDRLAPAADAYDASPAWFDICHHALALHRAGCRAGTVVSRPPGRSVNQLRKVHIEGDVDWWSAPAVETRLLREATQLEPGVPVKEHRLRSSTGPAIESACCYSIRQGLAAGAAYSGSFYLWVGADAAVERAGILLQGLSSVAYAYADLRIRGAWQRVWTNNRIGAGEEAISTGLFLWGYAGAAVRTTCWQLQTGPAATAYVSSRLDRIGSDDGTGREPE